MYYVIKLFGNRLVIRRKFKNSVWLIGKIYVGILKKIRERLVIVFYVLLNILII